MLNEYPILRILVIDVEQNSSFFFEMHYILIESSATKCFYFTFHVLLSSVKKK